MESGLTQSELRWIRHCLEATAVLLAIQSFHLGLKNSSICVLIDNTTAVSYINNMGGTHFENAMG